MRIAPVIVSLAALGIAAAAFAQPPGGRPDGAPPMRPQFQRPAPPPHYGGRMGWEERQRLREDLRSTNRDLYREPGAEEHDARRGEFARLREEVRAGRMSREDAMRRYRERFGDARPPQAGRLDPEERERLRRDLQEANRNLERR